MKTTLFIEPRIVYGKVLYYPDCEQSTKLAEFLGKKTFSKADLDRILSLGFEINYKNHYEKTKESL